MENSTPHSENNETKPEEANQKQLVNIEQNNTNNKSTEVQNNTNIKKFSNSEKKRRKYK